MVTGPVTVDWVLRHAHLPGRPALADIAIQGPRIATIGPSLALRGRQELDLAGRLVLPGFVDAHLHLDKALALEDGMPPADSLEAAIAAFFQWRRSVTSERIYANAQRVAERALLHGTLALRTHVTIDASGGLEVLESMLRLREAMAPRLTIQIVAFPDTAEVDRGLAKPLLRQAIGAGADLVGGAPAKSAMPRRFVDAILDLAGDLDCALDLHIDETDDPASNTLEYLAGRTLATGFQRTVTAGHCCALAAQDETTARRVIEKVAEAGLHILTLPYCNLYLMGRHDCGLVRRGLTRVHDLVAAGVNVAYGSDNIRDPFNPFGNADLLQTALITALALQMGTPAELANVVAMATFNPARILELDDYGLQQGNIASLVVIDATDLGTAVASTAPRRYVFAQGQLVAQTLVESQLLQQGEYSTPDVPLSSNVPRDNERESHDHVMASTELSYVETQAVRAKLRLAFSLIGSSATLHPHGVTGTARPASAAGATGVEINEAMLVICVSGGTVAPISSPGAYENRVGCGLWLSTRSGASTVSLASAWEGMHGVVPLAETAGTSTACYDPQSGPQAMVRHCSGLARAQASE